MVTRRTHRRELLLKPGPLTNQLIEYLLAVFVIERELLLHAITVISNRYHQVATDPKGAIVDFIRDFHSFIARNLNAKFGEFESIWSRTQTSLVSLEDDEAMIDKIAYTLSNPVSSFLVREAVKWPGVRRAWPAPAKVIKRPPLGIFADDERWPAEVTLEMTRPPCFDELDDEALAELIELRCQQEEQEARDEANRLGIRFLGRRAVRKQQRRSHPKSREPRFGISPRVACRDKWRRIERLQANKAWKAEYNDCRDRWRAGDRDVVFPYGTYLYRVRHSVRVAERPT
jgi:hypothetical protein